MANEKRLIDANALMDAFRSYMVERYDKEKCVSEENCKTCENSCLWRRIVGVAPTVDAVEVVHARWRWGYNSMNQYGAWCAECECGWEDKGTDDDFIRVLGLVIAHKYCPNCGAKMDGGNEDG